MNLIPTPRWIMDEWFFDPNVHGILQNVIQMPTWHPQPSLSERPRHHGKKIHKTISHAIINCHFILLTHLPFIFLQNR